MERVVFLHETGVAASSDAGNAWTQSKSEQWQRAEAMRAPPARICEHGTPAVNIVDVDHGIVIQLAGSPLKGFST